MAQLFKNAARSPLMASILAADTSLTVDAALADLFPVANTGTSAVGTGGLDYFKAVLQDTAGNIEIVYVRTRALGVATFTNVQRGQEGTTARNYAAGSIVGLRLTAADHENSLADLGVRIAAATSKATPVDADTLALSDSAASNVLKKLTWANLKSFFSPRATRIDVASVAGTVNLTTAAPDTDDIQITGALAITGFTVAVGRVVRVRAGGAFTLTSGASIVTQTGANIACVDGDTFTLRATAANVVEVFGFSSAHRLSVGTTQALTSGTTKDFPIAAGCKEFTISLKNLSHATSTIPWLQLGTASGFATSGYDSSATTNGVSASATAAVVLSYRADAAAQHYGHITGKLLDEATNAWELSGSTGYVGSADTSVIAGQVTLSGPLTQLRLTSAAAGTFDGGSANTQSKG